MKRIPLLPPSFLPQGAGLILCFSLSLIFTNLAAQNVSINTSGAPAHVSAMLDVSSDDKGILIPRMLTSQRESILNPAQGLLVYDIDTRSFWYHDGAWKEIMTGQDLTGPAGGDLIGSYPDPQVVKIQALDVAYGTPANKQVLKWDDVAQNWAGRNDSLFLPHHAEASDPQKLFSITNNWNGFSYSTAILGRRAGGSGISLPSSAGLWGDGASGAGVIGTSNTHAGMHGRSLLFHGIHGITDAGDKSGVYGENNAPGGTGVLGQSLTGFGIGGLTQGQNVAGVIGSNTHNGNNVFGIIGLIENATGGSAVYGKNNAPAGHAGWFNIQNTSNIDHALKATTSGNGAAGYFNTTGLGPAGYFVASNPASINPAVFISNFSNGTGLTVAQAATNTTHGIYVDGHGTGKSIYSTSEIGEAGVFEILNAPNEKSTLTASTVGKGLAATFSKNNTSGSISDIHKPAVLIDNNSKGHALEIKSLHSPSVNNALKIEYDGQAFGLNVSSTAGGILTTSTSNNWGLVAQNFSGGGAIKALSSNWTIATIQAEHSSSGGVAIKGIGSGNSGTGVAGYSSSNNYFQGSVSGFNNAPGIGVAVYGEATGTSGVGVLGRASGLGAAVRGENEGGGDGVYGYSEGDNANGVSGVAEATPGTFGIGVAGFNWGEGDGIRGFAGINGYGVSGHDGNGAVGGAGLFSIFYTTNTNDALKIENKGLGKSFHLRSTNSGNTSTAMLITKDGTADFAIYELENGDNKIRFDNAGKGFFDGGTQTGGADIAEAFRTENDATNYEPGDVLVISLAGDRQVTTSHEAYSPLVAGVYATKPGVLMTEEHIDADLSDHVPMGIIGVIPTKVCLEGGTIRRGDLIVTSSQQGVAMKGDADKIKPGMLIGKALENYEGTGNGLIRVLVNVR